MFDSVVRFRRKDPMLGASLKGIIQNGLRGTEQTRGPAASGCFVCASVPNAGRVQSRDRRWSKSRLNSWSMARKMGAFLIGQSSRLLHRRPAIVGINCPSIHPLVHINPSPTCDLQKHVAFPTFVFAFEPQPTTSKFHQRRSPVKGLCFLNDFAGQRPRRNTHLPVSLTFVSQETVS